MSSLVLRTVFLVVPLAVAPRKIRWLLAAPLAIPLAGLLLRGGNGLTTFFHYDMMFVPLLILVVALSPRADLRPRLVPIMSLVVIATLGVLRPFEPMHGPNLWRIDRSLTAELDQALETVLSSPNPEGSSLSAPSRLLPHLTERQNVFIFPSPFDGHPDDNSGYALVERVDFACPPPNLVVQSALAQAPRWEQERAVGYQEVDSHGTYSVWHSEEPFGNEPCSAVWVLSQ